MKDFFQIEDIQDLPNAIENILFSDNKNELFNQFLDMHENNLSYDWFQNIYESELAQRNQNKQDFTPNSVGVLLSNLTGVAKGKIYEPTAGNGSLIIANWNYRKDKLRDEFNSIDHPVECWELSNRSIPILLLNLSIRGIIGEVYHGDVLTKEIKAKYRLSKSNQFSKIEKHEV